MDNAQFQDGLEKLKQKYIGNFAPNRVADATTELALLVQDYLWEGDGSKTLNKAKFRKLSLQWHTDKLTNLNNNDTSKEFSFALWFSGFTNDTSAAIKVVNEVKERYRPELRFRAQDARSGQDRAQHNVPFNMFYGLHFFSFAARFSPSLYNLFWPLMYLFEALERNLDNYQDLNNKKYAKILYMVFAAIPGIIIYAISDHDISKMLSLFLSPELHYTLVTLPFLGLFGLGLAGFAIVVTLNLLSNDAVAFENMFENSNDKLLSFFVTIPLKCIQLVWERLGQPKVGTPLQQLLQTAKEVALFVLTAGIIAGCSYVCFISAQALFPFIISYAAFPLVGLILANAPLMAWQIKNQPKESFNTVKEYFFTIGNRYASLARQGAYFAYEFIKSKLPTFKSKAQPSSKPRPAPRDAANEADRLNELNAKLGDAPLALEYQENAVPPIRFAREDANADPVAPQSPEPRRAYSPGLD